MNADEVVRVLRSYSQSLVGYKLGCEFADAVENGASLIESLQAQLAASQRRAQDARNELCLKCGRYHEAHNGACDGCRWKEV